MIHAKTIRFLLVICLSVYCCGLARGDIKNWQTGETIPGTEGITPGPGIDLSNRNTELLNLRFASLADENLVSALFNRSWLDNARLGQADLGGASFFETVLTAADLSSSNLANANLAGALVDEADLSSTTSMGFTKEQLYSTASYQNRQLPRIKLYGNNLSGWDFTNQDLFDAELFTTDLSSANFSSANLAEVQFQGSSLAQATLAGADLTDASLFETNLRDTTSRGFTKEQFYSTGSYRFNSIQGIGLAQNDLTGWFFAFRDLTGADVSSSTLTNADFADAIVKEANFSDTTSRGFTMEQLYSTVSYQSKDLQGIGLSENDLTDWDFANYDMTFADLSTSTLTGVNLAGALVTWASLSDTTSRGFTKEQFYSTANYKERIPMRGLGLSHNDMSGWDFSNQNMLESDFTSSSLVGADLTGTDLLNATLANADLTDATVTETRFWFTTQRGFTKEQLYSTRNYQDRDLRGISFRGNEMNGWDFGNQNLSKAIFVESDAVSSNFGDANLTNAILSRSNLTEADLSGADLTNAVLAESVLSRANLLGTNLMDAVVAFADFSDTTSSGFTKEQLYSTFGFQEDPFRIALSGIKLGSNDLSGWDFAGKGLPFASFADSTLVDADLTNTDLFRADFTGADLANTDMTGAYLFEALGFSPDASTIVRNIVWPDGHIRGLDLQSGESLTLPGSLEGVASSFRMTIEEGFGVADEATLEVLIGSLMLDDTVPVSTHLELLPGIPIELGGTLKVEQIGSILFFDRPTVTFDIFDWPEPLADDNRFSSIELPPGVWDVSKLYTTGEITLIPEPAGHVLLIAAFFPFFARGCQMRRT